MSFYLDRGERWRETMSTADLKPRSLPQQSRSRATVEHVLRVSMELLDEVGVEAFNTNLLAERAGVGLRAIYRYFPNKLTILIALAERMRDHERSWIGDLRDVAGRENWRAAVAQSIDGYYKAASTQSGFLGLRAAVNAIPELRAIDAAASAELQMDLATGLARLGIRLSPGHLKVVCQTIVESANRMLDIALMSRPAHAKMLVRELKHMITSLLARYLD